MSSPAPEGDSCAAITPELVIPTGTTAAYSPGKFKLVHRRTRKRCRSAAPEPAPHRSHDHRRGGKQGDPPGYLPQRRQ